MSINIDFSIPNRTIKSPMYNGFVNHIINPFLKMVFITPLYQEVKPPAQMLERRGEA